jgi:hypothetical protein
VTVPAYKATEAGVRAHAPEAFMAFRSQQRQQHAADFAGTTDLGFTPSQWRGWSIVDMSTLTSANTATDNNVTFYVRDEDVPAALDPVEETTAALVEGGMTPEEAIEVAARDDEEANNEVVITRVESESDTLTRQDDSVESPASTAPPEGHPSSADDAPPQEHPSSGSDDAPPEHPVDDDAPTTDGHPSSKTPKRHSLTRKAITLDEMGERMNAKPMRTDRYWQLNPTE